MIRAVLGVDVLVSGFPSDRGAPAATVERWAGVGFKLVLSEHILDSLEHAWDKLHVRPRYDGARVQQTLVLLRSKATFVVSVPSVRRVAVDEEDDIVLVAAAPAKPTTSSPATRGRWRWAPSAASPS